MTTLAPPCELQWDVQPLEGFESAPIEQTARRYDLIVIDHPHLGDALACGSLLPLESVFTAEDLGRWRDASVGASADSYRMAGSTWAVPLDAATQVSARKFADTPDPGSWEDVLTAAEDGLAVALPGAGPHPFLTLCSIAVADGESPGAGEEFLSPGAVERGIEILRRLLGPADLHRNPIAVLDAMRTSDGPEYCPHVYGYVTYAQGSQPLLFGEAPTGLSGRHGSVLGGTGIAVSARCTPDNRLREHLRWLLDAETQRGFVVRHRGQPADRAAWEDAEVNALSAGFYSRTRRTMEQAWVRPRQAGAIAFQTAAADAVRECLTGHHDVVRLSRQLTDLYTSTFTASQEFSR